MNALGTHLILELKDCFAGDLLNNVQQIEYIMVEAAKKAKATVLSANFHTYNPHGVSGVVIIAESHLTIHTWPEYNYAAVDIFTCGDLINPAVAADFLIKEFNSKTPFYKQMKRGILQTGSEGTLPYKPGVQGSSGYESIDRQTVR